MSNRSLLSRMIGAALLDVSVYEEVEANEDLTGQAAFVVILFAVAAGLAGWQGETGIVRLVLAALLGWIVWAGITYLIGDKMLGGTASWGELLRTLGFAHAPGVLLVLAFLPLIGWIVRVAVPIWLLICGIVALRQALDFGTGKAMFTAFLGWVVTRLLPSLFWLPLV